MTKYFSIMTLINGIPQHTEITKNILYYSIGEAEFHLSKLLEKDNEINYYVIIPTYRKGVVDTHYIKTRSRIAEKYPELQFLTMAIQAHPSLGYTE